jgi:protein gp37
MESPVAIPRSVARTMTGIEWTDFSANAWIGCTRVKPRPGALSGCDSPCYAEIYARRLGVEWGPGKPRLKTASHASRLRRLDRLAASLGLRFSVFQNSLSDWLDQEVDREWLREMVRLAEDCVHLDHLLLTHRPQQIRRLLPESWLSSLPANVWPGVTVDHALHAERWDILADVWGPTGRAWVSAEPLLSDISGLALAGAVVVVVGGASKTSDPAYAMKPEWARAAVEAFRGRIFFKQWGDRDEHGQVVGKKVAGRAVDGMVHDWTPWSRNREMLKAAGNAQATAGSGDRPDRHPAS